MPTLDKPLHELKVYEGSSPCPEDIDLYWDKAILEMKALHSEVTITPSSFNVPFAECFDLVFTGMGGSRIYSKLLKPKNISGQCPAIVKFHGYSGSSGDWTDHLAHVAAGFIVVAMDCRGQGGRSEDLGGSKGNTLFGDIVRGVDVSDEDLYYRNVYLDCAQLAGIVLSWSDVDQTRVIATGASQGGALTIACAALEPRIAKAITIYPFLCDYKRVWEMDLDIKAYEGIREYLRRFDPRHENIDAFFMRLGYIDLQNIAKRIQGEVVMVTGLMDDICPPSTQFAAYNKMKSQKEVIIYPDFGHENLPGLSDIMMQHFCRMI